MEKRIIEIDSSAISALNNIANAITSLAESLQVTGASNVPDTVTPTVTPAPEESSQLVDWVGNEPGVVFVEDVNLHSESELESLKRSASILREYAELDDVKMPKDKRRVTRILTFMADSMSAGPRWNPSHIHVDNNTILNSACIDIAEDAGGIPAAAKMLAVLGKGVGSSSSITVDEASDIELERSELETKLIREGRMSGEDFLLTKEELLRGLGMDYTALSLPGVAGIFSHIEGVEDSLSAVSALSVISKAAAFVWDVDAVEFGMRAFAVALNKAAIVKELALSALLESKFASEIADGKEFLTIPQIEKAFNKKPEEVAAGICGADLRILMTEDNGSNVFVVEKSTIKFND